MILKKSIQIALFLFLFIIISCSFISKNKPNLFLNNNYIGSTSSGIFQKVSEEILFNNNYSIATYDVKPTYIQINTNWKNRELFDAELSNNFSKARTKIKLTASVERNIDFKFIPNKKDCYIEIINQVYNGTEWKQINLSNELINLLNDLTNDIRTGIHKHNSIN